MKPRERMMKSGPQALSNEELIAVLLRTGDGEKGVLELAEEILRVFPRLSDLASATLQELMSVKGVGLAKATAIKAAMELGKRLHEEMVNKPRKLKTPQDVFLLCSDMRFSTNEILRVIPVDSSLSYIGHLDFPGLSSGVSILVRDVMRYLLRVGAVAFFVAHNHHSSCRPSEEDEFFTSKLSSAGDILGVKLVDHLIVCPKGFYSFGRREMVEWSSKTRG